jgi:tetratricopeptide (TPR) repeat protein
MHMEHLAEQEARGALEGDPAREVNRYWSTHLRRGPMTPLDSARYSIAELLLRRGEPKEAIATLAKALDAASEDLKALTHLNLAEVYRRVLDDAPKAIEHYQKVEGALRPRAQLFLLALLAETGKADEAAKQLEGLIQAATEKGEKLALLQRLAALHEKARMLDKALAAYERILKEFTPQDIEAMRQAASAEARGTVQKMDAARRNGDGQEVERLERGLRRRAEDLRTAGRWEELRAFEQAARALMQELFRPGPPPQRDQPREPAPKREGEF